MTEGMIRWLDMLEKVYSDIAFAQSHLPEEVKYEMKYLLSDAKDLIGLVLTQSKSEVKEK